MLEEIEKHQSQGVELSELSTPKTPLVIVRNVDERGSISIPQEIREMLGDDFISYHRKRGGELLLYSLEAFSQVRERLREAIALLPGVDQRAIERLFYSRINKCSFDSRGKFNLSLHLGSSEPLPMKVQINWNKGDARIFLTLSRYDAGAA